MNYALLLRIIDENLKALDNLSTAISGAFPSGTTPALEMSVRIVAGADTYRLNIDPNGRILVRDERNDRTLVETTVELVRDAIKGHQTAA